MNLLFLKLLFINIYLVSSFELRVSTNWERLVNKIIESGGNSVKVDETEKWIEQPLDHFDKNEKRTWKMRYFEDLSNWQSGGPVILSIGGENATTPARFGLLYELATETRAAVFFSEHRYYGESQPLSNVTTSNLKYLDSTQALYDNANLLKFIKSNTKFKTSKVVAFGGSYAGNLAAWIRLLFPDLVDSAVSSSAPVLAKKDFYEYSEVVGKVIKRFPQCYETILKHFTRNKELLKTASGIEVLKKENNICPDVDLTQKENIMLFFHVKMSTIMGAVQNAFNAKDIQENICSFPKLNFSNTHTACQTYNFNDEIEYYKTNEEVKFMYMWLYQSCTEFGYFKTGSSKKQPFTDIVTVEFYLAMCKGLYGTEFNEQKVDEGVARTNKKYGGLNPNVDKVIFVNGDMDPWALLGIETTDNALAVVIKDASHCSDYYPFPNNADARMKWQVIKNAVKSWIGLL